MYLYNIENWVMPAGVTVVASAVEEAYLEANKINPAGVIAYREMAFGPKTYIEWWVEWTHPVTGRVYVEERQRIKE